MPVTMEKQEQGFRWPIRVYYEDTDAGGIVYHANYLRFMEQARTEWLRHLGFEQDQLRDEADLIFVVRSIDLAYRRPARFNDQLEVAVDLLETRRASLLFSQSVHLRDEADSVLCSSTVQVACVHASSLKPRGIPDFVIQRIIQ